MKILHYTLGLPPMRSGGLPKYAQDLMEEQSKNNEVMHLFPGNIDLLNKKTRILKRNKFQNEKIDHFEIINSLPLPLFKGIKQPKDFMMSGPILIYSNFLEKIRPDVIHIHTLMGLHKEFVDSAKKLNIKLIYTTHDYFGICPTINLYREKDDTICNNYENGKGCIECNCNAMATSMLLLSQTPIYPFIKKFKKNISRKLINQDRRKSTVKTENTNQVLANDFFILRNYYLNILRKIDFFHFNSNLSKQIYKSYLPEIDGEVIDITHKGIKKAEITKKQNPKIRLGYIGPLREYKGYYLLQDVFKELSSEQFELHLYGDDSKLEASKNIYQHGRYSSEDLNRIFSEIDVLIVPSKWKETFGFIVLEALSHGIPVIVSQNVGSKDLVLVEFGWTVPSNSFIDLYELLANLNKEIIIEKHLNILNNFKPITIRQHSKYIENIYYQSK